MLALSRIAAMPDGISPPLGVRRPGKATRDSITPFLAMLSGLSSGKTGKAEKTAGAKVPAAPDLGPSMAKAKLPGRNDTAAGSQRAPTGSGLPSNERIAEKAMPRSKDIGRIAVRNDKTAKAKTNAGGDDEAHLGSIAAASLTGMQAEPKAGPNRKQSTSAGSGNRGAGEQSGIEVTGTGSAAGKNGASLSIIDLRLKARSDGSARRESSRSGIDGDASAASSKADRATAGAQVESDPSMFAGRLSPSATGKAEDAAPNASGQAASRSFTESLASRLRDGAADIVRSAQVVLRDGGLGMIRLRLEPESLGGVKIELKLAEKQISGKIVVESEIAGEAFKSSLDALKDAFADCGFETTSLEVEVRNGMASGTGANGHHPGEAGMDEGPYWSRSLRELDAAVPAVAAGGRDGLLNVIV